jgi:deazaflavin-dependent oxidoreductase (nitroreductase family)
MEVTMWYNPIMRGLLNSPLHFMVSNNMMLMTYTGRKSGKSYTTPMNYLAINGAIYTTSYRERVWWRNLRDGAEVTLHLKGEEVPARAETIEDQTKVADSMGQYLKTAPHLAKYMNVRMDADGNPDVEDVARLAQEMIMVRTELK